MTANFYHFMEIFKRYGSKHLFDLPPFDLIFDQVFRDVLMDQASLDMMLSVRPTFKSAKYSRSPDLFLLSVACVGRRPWIYSVFSEHVHWLPDARHESDRALSAVSVVVIAPSSEDGQPAVNNRPILLSSFAVGALRRHGYTKSLC